MRNKIAGALFCGASIMPALGVPHTLALLTFTASVLTLIYLPERKDT